MKTDVFPIESPAEQRFLSSCFKHYSRWAPSRLRLPIARSASGRVRPAHGLRVPGDLALLALARVAQERGAGRAQAEDGVLHHRRPRAHGLDEVRGVGLRLVVLRGALVALLAPGPDLVLAVRILLAVLREVRVLDGLGEGVDGVAGLPLRLALRDRDPLAADVHDPLRTHEAEGVLAACPRREVDAQGE